jgi:hypothetical protein
VGKLYSFNFIFYFLFFYLMLERVHSNRTSENTNLFRGGYVTARREVSIAINTRKECRRVE